MVVVKLIDWHFHFCQEITSFIDSGPPCRVQEELLRLKSQTASRTQQLGDGGGMASTSTAALGDRNRELAMADGTKLVKVSTHIIEDLYQIKKQLGADSDGLEKVHLTEIPCIFMPADDTSA